MSLWLVVASICNAGKVETYSSAHKRRDGSGTVAQVQRTALPTGRQAGKC